MSTKRPLKEIKEQAHHSHREKNITNRDIAMRIKKPKIKFQLHLRDDTKTVFGYVNEERLKRAIKIKGLQKDEYKIVEL